MLTFNEMENILIKGKLAIEKEENLNIQFEVSSLERELKSVKKQKGIMAEMTLMACEYFANELNKSLISLVL